LINHTALFWFLVVIVSIVAEHYTDVEGEGRQWMKLCFSAPVQNLLFYVYIVFYFSKTFIVHDSNWTNTRHGGFYLSLTFPEWVVTKIQLALVRHYPRRIAAILNSILFIFLFFPLCKIDLAGLGIILVQTELNLSAAKYF
jgi:hypothetical protein